MALIFFYGRECPHCERMQPLIDRLEAETGAAVERLEVWYDEANFGRLKECDDGSCGGVPFFCNTDTDKTICGEAEYEALKSWAGK